MKPTAAQRRLISAVHQDGWSTTLDVAASGFSWRTLDACLARGWIKMMRPNDNVVVVTASGIDAINGGDES